jgi:hypothetical protein
MLSLVLADITMVCSFCGAYRIPGQKENVEEKKFAATMVTDHTKTSTELKEMMPADMKSALPTALAESLITHVSFDFLKDLVSLDFGLTTMSGGFRIWLGAIPPTQP